MRVSKTQPEDSNGRFLREAFQRLETKAPVDVFRENMLNFMNYENSGTEKTATATTGETEK